MDGAESQKNHETKSVVAAMLRYSIIVIVIVVHTRPRAIPLAMITTKKITSWVSFDFP